ncbi:cadherin domain protein, partial [Opisthorchis viverrini]
GADAKGFELDYGQSSENSDVSHSNNRISLDTPKRLKLLSRTELNHERKTEHHLLLVARDNCETGSARHSTQLPIFVLVREVNEYAPQFNLGVSEADKQNNHPDLFRDMARYHSSVLLECLKNASSNSFPKLAIDIPENMPVGSRIYRVVATDKDVYMDGDVGKGAGAERRSTEYSLASGTDLKIRRYFRVGTADGWITLIHQMDYETGPKMFEFQIIATDAGRPVRTSTLGIVIRTIDVNDEAPIVEIRGITPLTKLNTASPGTLFGGSFTSRFHVLTVKENLPSGTFVAKISASDRDKGPAGDVACRLDEPPVMMMKTPTDQTSFVNTLSKQTSFILKPASSKEITTSLNAPSSNFAAEPNPTGRRSADYVLVTNRLLDREDQEVYLLAVICHDHGDSGDGSSGLQVRKLHEARRLSSTSLVKIFVLDENDNGPRFVSHNQNIQVPENTVHGTRLIQLKSIDKDAPGPNSQTLYRFADHNDLTGQNNTDFDGKTFRNHFEIEESTGWIRAGKLPLDRETHDSWRIPVVAFDAEFPNRTNLAWVNVKVSDVNDNVPRLVSNTTFWIEEEIGTGPSIANYQSTWYTNRQIFVGHLKAEDADLNDSGRVTFSLPDAQNDSACNLRWFLRSDGNLFVYPGANATIDREQQDVYFLPVVLRDHGSNVSLSFSTTLTVKVLDKNDNAPSFVRPPSSRIDSFLTDQTSVLPYRPPGSMLPVATLRLPESTSPGTVVYTALATDPDDGENGRVIYSLEVYLGVWQLMNSRKPSLNQTNMSSNNQYFVIDRSSGEVRLNQRLHASDLNRPDKFVIFAEDCGTPAKQSYAFLHVEIESKLAESVATSKSGLSKLVSLNGPAVYNESDKGRRNKLSSNQRPEEHMHTGASLVTERRRPGFSLVDNPPYRQTSSAIIAWNSELVTGLGIGLLIVILLCLLLLVTYALHGTKLMPNRLRRPAGSTHGFKLGKIPIRPRKLSDTSTDKAKRISSSNNQ